MGYRVELVAVSPELKKQLDELKHELNFTKAANYRKKRVLAFGDVIKMIYDFYIANGGDKKDLEVPNESQQGTDTISSS